MAAVPTPDAPAWTSAHRPLVSPPCTTSASHAVRNTSGIAAASASDTRVGHAPSAGARARRSARRRRRRRRCPSPRRPAATASPARPTAATVPANSSPGISSVRRARVRVEAHPLQQVGPVQRRRARRRPAPPPARRPDRGRPRCRGPRDHHGSKDDGAHACQSTVCDRRRRLRRDDAGPRRRPGRPRSSSPSPMSISAPRAPITAGMPSSRASTAAWLIGPPSEVTTPPAMDSTRL